jgi:hypothetical protein
LVTISAVSFALKQSVSVVGGYVGPGGWVSRKPDDR